MGESQGKVSGKSTNFEKDIEWQPRLCDSVVVEDQDSG